MTNIEKALSKTQIAVMRALYMLDGRYSGDTRLLSYKTITKETKLTPIAVKRGVRSLLRAKLVEHSPAFDEDGLVSGSGFMLSPEGERAIEPYITDHDQLDMDL